MKKLAKQYAPPTRAQLGLTEAAAAIRENPDAAEIAFMVRQLILCTLPHSDPEKPKRQAAKCSVCGNKIRICVLNFDSKSEDLLAAVLTAAQFKCASCNQKLATSSTTTIPTVSEHAMRRKPVEQWARRYGDVFLGITPGRDFKNNRSIGYPFGIIPRLLLLWMTTEVHRRKNNPDLTPLEKRTLQLGSSLADFMRKVGLNPDNGTGERGDRESLQDQMDRLISSRISFQQSIETADATGKRWRNMEIAPEGELWWHKRPEGQSPVQESWIRLGEDFFNALATLSSPPVDLRAVLQLRSPMEIDLYILMCYRAYLIVKKDLPPQFTAWSVLKDQLGADYGTSRNFQISAQAALRKVAELYPGLTVRKARGGFTIHATRLAVPELPALPE
jgi:hypothetical protein